LAAEELGTCEEIRQIGGDSGRLRSIPWTGKKRAALRSFSARRPGWGRHGTATLGGSHGGSSSSTGRFTVKKEHERKQTRDRGERGGKEGGQWHRWGPPGVLLDGQAVRSRRWHRQPPGTATQMLEVEDKATFSENPLDL
jgi:hypothetical protein